MILITHGSFLSADWLAFRSECISSYDGCVFAANYSLIFSITFSLIKINDSRRQQILERAGFMYLQRFVEICE